jgi:DNA (cytosine-5)-methyltransferase 1
MSLRLLSLCSGIGMIDYVWSIILGQEIAGQVEIKPYCQALLAERWPTVPKACDIKEIIDNDPFGTVDLVAGGIPCQPFSNSGKRRGTDDDRHLWPSAFAIVQRRKPTWVLIENVAGFVSLALDMVQTDLESEGYQSRAYVLPACAIGAPHERKRVFILAHTTSRRLEVSQTATQFPIQSRSPGIRMADTYGNRQWDREGQPQHIAGGEGTPIACTHGTQGTLAHTHCNQCGIQWERVWANPESKRQNGACPQSQRCRECKSCCDRLPQSRMDRELDGLADWMDSTRWPALPGEPQHAWEPPRTIARKVPHHDARLEALGNTVVPQQIYPFLQFIVTYERGRL